MARKQERMKLSEYHALTQKRKVSQHKAGEMNMTEREHASMLDVHKSAGFIKSYLFEKVTFRLGYRTSYTPDFFVEMPDGTFEVHEIKGGFVRDDAMAKFKIAASMFPFRFFLYQKIENEWAVIEY
jgi:hypothetical protein